jgi:enamine deaminase RidA (YjgF/YER057c/UK114 family)
MLGDTDMPASTIIGIPALAAKDRLIEIEAIAVISTRRHSSK